MAFPKANPESERGRNQEGQADLPDWRDPASRASESDDPLAQDSVAASPAIDADDRNKERWRLAWRYGGMTVGELEALAADAGSLTEVARRALRSELNRRGLTVELQAPAPAAAAPTRPPQSRRLVTIRRFRDMPEALLAKSVLESAGLFCSLDDANIIRTDWLWSNMLGGIKLRVQEEDLEVASNLLNQATPELEAASSGEFPEPACPRCRSVDISLEGWHEPAANSGRLVVASNRDSNPAWICHSCGHRWQDSDPGV